MTATATIESEQVTPADGALCDRCGANLQNLTLRARERQRRFLDAYRQSPIIAKAARLAGVNRSTVHRWATDPAFTAAMETEADAYYRERRDKVAAAQADRQRWREARERDRLPMRRENLARARAKRRQGMRL